MSLEERQIGRYRFLRLLGSGGMGDVYLAEDARIEQQVAVKVLRAEGHLYPKAMTAQDAIRLFRREAKAIAKLDHPHILPLFDYGEESIGDTTIIYLVMPYRQEGSLASWLRQRQTDELLSPQDVLHIVGQAADALQHAHSRQIIHQDVKPSNFLLRHREDTLTSPDLLLADFGIARFTTAISSASQSIRGTPTYMAPEQWEGEPAPATDQYALAVMTYELLTGRPPFQGGPGRMMYQHINVQPPLPSALNPRLPGEIDAVLLHALAKKPEKRFASITAFADAFQQAVQGIDIPTLAPALTASPTTPVSHGDIHVVLAISAAEARMGTTRMVTLPRGRNVMVTVPAGIEDGQVIRLDGQSEPSNDGGSVGALILTIVVKQEEEALLASSSVVLEETALAANAKESEISATIANNVSAQPIASNVDPSILQASTVPVTSSNSFSENEEGPTQQSTLDAQATRRNMRNVAQGETSVPEGNGPIDLPTNKESAPLADEVSIAAPRGRAKRRPVLITVLVLLAVLLVGSGIVYAAPSMFTSLAKNASGVLPKVPLTADSALVTITPASRDLKNTYTISAVTGIPDASKHQVGARLLSSTTSSQTQTAKATGVGTIPGTHASGTVAIDNFDTASSLTLTAGSVFTNTYGASIHMVLDATVTVPPAPSSTVWSQELALGHILEVGTIGNNEFNNNISGSISWSVFNNPPFSNGKNPQTYTAVQQSDITSAANALIFANTPDPKQVMQSQIRLNERLIGTPQCKPNVSSDHKAGDKATSVTVTLTFTCTGEVYDYDGARSLAAKLLNDQAANDPGPGYVLVGNIATILTSATLADARQGTIALTVNAEGVWAFQFSDAQKQHLAKLIAGKKKGDAQTILLTQEGVAQVDGVQVSGGDRNILPTDWSRITIAVKSVRGL